MAKKLTVKQAEYRKNLLAKIHCSSLFNSMEDEDYRDMLEAHFSKRSAGLLSINQLLLLLDYMQGKRGNMIEMITAAQIHHIEKTWQAKAKNPTMGGLRKFVASNFKKTILGVNALTKKEASGIIRALNNMRPQ